MQRDYDSEYDKESDGVMFDRSKSDKAILMGNIEWRKHSLQRILERAISRADVCEVVTNGEVIEDYPTDKPFPSALFFKSVSRRPLHVVAAFDEKEERVYIITTYEPTLDKFEQDFKTRRNP
jgi:hypothetical protein